MRKAAKRFFLAVFGLFNACHVHAHTRGTSLDTCAIDPKAIVSDACASFSTLDGLNAELQPTIRSLTHDSDFFSFYRLNLYNKECPFWSDDSGLCGNIACAVNTIENEEDIPLIWRAEELGKLEGPKAQHPNRKMQMEPKPLMGELGEEVGESCVVEYDDECDERDYCVPEDESATAKGDYVSLVDNPERFTGYSGPSAHHVWEAIYRENCFPREATPKWPSYEAFAKSAQLGFSGPRKAAQDFRSVMREHNRHQSSATGSSSPVKDEDEFSLSESEQCLEKRVFYRIISGMHASISTHLCYDYLNQTSGQWGPNLTCYTNRLHSHPDRISNLYFNYALVLRAISKLKPTLSDYTFCSGDPEQDTLTKNKIIALADQIAAGPQIYDESMMFRDPSIAGLKDDFRNRFRNVSRTMDCVGCDKCRLWGKLQTAGFGTALKVLFEFGEGSDESDDPLLRRTELVALVNTLDKLSHSLSAIKTFEEMIMTTSPQHLSTPAISAKVSERSASQNLTTQEGASNADASAIRTPLAISSTVPDASENEHVTDSDFYPDSHNETPRQSLASEFEDEFTLIWNTTAWVLRSWIDLPLKVFHICIMELSRLWDYWLGRTSDVEWKWGDVQWAPGLRGPARDEI